MITRNARQSRDMEQMILDYGGEPVQVPLMTYEPVLFDKNDKCQLLNDIKSSDWLVFTSGNTVKFFFDLVDPQKDLHQVKIAAVGVKTKAVLETYDLKVDFVPNTFTADALADIFCKDGSKRGSVFIPMGQLAKAKLKSQLTEAGFKVKTKVVYNTMINKASQQLLTDLVFGDKIDVITFASPSAVTFFTELLKGYDYHNLLRNKVIACIGAVTAEQAASYGFRPSVVPEHYTGKELIQAVAKFYMEE
ncbi:uroporphyrinogen-III synthase [Scopulibacillus darangshiensis]|nr:uroporphyrinogen-III synthase [Scopulibacillus darangshiensis]